MRDNESAEHEQEINASDRTPETVGEGPEGQVEDEDADAETETEEVEAEAEESPEGQNAKPPEGQKPATEAAKPVPREPEGRVPSARLREQTERTRALETERDALKAELATTQTTSRAEVAALNARLDGVLAAIWQQPQPQNGQQKPQAEVVPDMFEDPKGFARMKLRSGQIL